MPSEKDVLSNAGQLAEFTNVKNDEELKIFRNRNGNFSPPSLWDGLDVETQWENLPQSSEPTFEPFDTEVFGPGLQKLISSGGASRLHSWRDLRDVTRLAWERKFSLDICLLLLNHVIRLTPTLIFPPYACQRAIVFLAIEPWRARFCSICGRRFVADKNARRYCSTDCSSRARLDSRNAWWKAYGNEWRAETRTANARNKKPSHPK